MVELVPSPSPDLNANRDTGVSASLAIAKAATTIVGSGAMHELRRDALATARVPAMQQQQQRQHHLLPPPPVAAAECTSHRRTNVSYR